MARQTLGSKKKINQKAVQQRLDDNYAEWTEEDFHHTVEHAYLIFKISRSEKGSSKPTLDHYDRMYQRLKKVTQDGKLPVKILTQFGFQSLFISALGDVSQQTINYYLRGLRTFGNYCEEIGLISGFTCPIKEIEPEIKQVYTDDEIRRLLVRPNPKDHEQYRNYIVILLFTATGARTSTILNLKVKDVDLEEGYINFNHTKSHKVVRIGLEKKLKKELAEYISIWHDNPEDYLIRNRFGEQMTRNGLYQAITAYNKRRGVDRSGLHLFRHQFAKHWITSGGDIISLANVLTHSELSMVKRYSNLYGTDIKKEIMEHSTLSAMRTNSGKTIGRKK